MRVRVRARTGFCASQDLVEEDPHGLAGNYGLYDVVSALEWVRPPTSPLPSPLSFSTSHAPRRARTHRSSPTSASLAARPSASRRSDRARARSSSRTCSCPAGGCSRGRSARVARRTRWCVGRGASLSRSSPSHERARRCFVRRCLSPEIDAPSPLDPAPLSLPLPFAQMLRPVDKAYPAYDPILTSLGVDPTTSSPSARLAALRAAPASQLLDLHKATHSLSGLSLALEPEAGGRGTWTRDTMRRLERGERDEWVREVVMGVTEDEGTVFANMLGVRGLFLSSCSAGPAVADLAHPPSADAARQPRRLRRLRLAVPRLYPAAHPQRLPPLLAPRVGPGSPPRRGLRPAHPPPRRAPPRRPDLRPPGPRPSRGALLGVGVGVGKRRDPRPSVALPPPHGALVDPGPPRRRPARRVPLDRPPVRVQLAQPVGGRRGEGLGGEGARGEGG